MSGWVTVSGPPRASWRWNSGTTRAGAAEHVAEPHGDAAHAACRAARAAISSAWQYISASRLEAPMTLVGLTALSVEISTIASAPAARAASATWRVPAALVSSPSSGLASTIGTCFSAAAWNTSSGRNSSNSARMRARRGYRRSRRGAARRGGSPPVPGRSATARIRRCRAAPAAPGPRAATWRASSLPMVPPAPVTSTRRPCISRAMPSRSSGTCGRFSRSSMATGRSSTRAAPPRRRCRARSGAARGRRGCLRGRPLPSGRRAVRRPDRPR